MTKICSSSIIPRDTNTDTFSEKPSYVAIRVFVPWKVGSHKCVKLGVRVPSEIDVQFSSGIITGSLLPLMSILVALISNISSAVIAEEDEINSRDAISPYVTSTPIESVKPVDVEIVIVQFPIDTPV